MPAATSVSNRQKQQRLGALLLLLLSMPALAIQIVNTNNAGIQTPFIGITPLASGISNDGDSVLFWAPHQGLIFDPGPTPNLFFQNNIFVKTVSNNQIVEVARRSDNQPLNCCGVHPYAHMDEPPNNVVFWSGEANLLSGTSLQKRVFTTRIGSFQYTPVRGLASDLLVAGTGDFTTTRNLDRIYLQTGASFEQGMQIVEVSPTEPTPPIVHSLRADGTPSQAFPFSTEAPYWPDLTVSADGRILVWRGLQTDIAPGGFGPVSPHSNNRILFMRNTQTQVTKRVFAEDGSNLFYPIFPRISDDGSLLAFNLIGYFFPGCGDAIVAINPDTEQRECISVSNTGALGNRASTGRLDVSGDGSRVVFANTSTNLTDVAQNPALPGIYVRDRKLRRTVRVDVNLAGEPGNGFAEHPRISKNGRWVVFTSRATNLIENDTNGSQSDIFRVDLNRFLPDPSAPSQLQPVSTLSVWSLLALAGLMVGVARKWH